MNKEGLKFDSGKSKIGMVFTYFSRALQIVAAIGTYGSKKYGKTGEHWDYNWKEVKDAEKRYSDAMFRHWFASHDEFLDSESGFPHLGHMAWNALALLQLKLTEVEQGPVVDHKLRGINIKQIFIDEELPEGLLNDDDREENKKSQDQSGSDLPEH